MDENETVVLLDLFNSLPPEKQEQFIEYLREIVASAATAKAG